MAIGGIIRDALSGNCHGLRRGCSLAWATLRRRDCSDRAPTSFRPTRDSCYRPKFGKPSAELSDLSAFDYVVAENGAVVYEPRTREETLLAQPLPAKFVERLKELAVDPLEVGKVIVATWVPHQITMLQVVQEMGLEVHIVFNRAAVMALPPGVSKATGMSYVLRKLGLSAHEVVGIGDSENDHSFLERSECAATVANAVPSIRAIASIVAKL